MLFFADNTVLVNFGHIGQIELLRRLTRSGARWSVSVAAECAESALYDGLEELAKAPSIFGDGEALNDGTEWRRMTEIRSRLMSPGDGPKKHLGEAETIAIMSSRFPQDRFVTDDFAAAREAAGYGIKTIDTGQLILLAVRVKFVSVPDGWSYFKTLRAKRRHVGSAPANEQEYLALVTA